MSVHALLEARGIVATQAIGTLAAVPARQDDAALLATAEGSPLLVERRRIVDQHGGRIESTETRYVGPSSVLDTQLQRAQDAVVLSRR